jgi:hypothetical protein
MKKKKSFKDGILKIDTRSYTCTLKSQNQGNNPDGCLESKILPREFMLSILSGKSTNIEFENFLVQIDDIERESVHSKVRNQEQIVGELPKLSKFKIPTKISSTGVLLPDQFRIQGQGKIPSIGGTGSYNVSESNICKSTYVVHDQELDEIWTEIPAPPASFEMSKSICPQVSERDSECEYDVNLTMDTAYDTGNTSTNTCGKKRKINLWGDSDDDE